MDASELEWEDLDRLRDAAQIAAAGGPPPVWLALDEVQDPVHCHPCFCHLTCILHLGTSPARLLLADSWSGTLSGYLRTAIFAHCCESAVCSSVVGTQ